MTRPVHLLMAAMALLAIASLRMPARQGPSTDQVFKQQAIEQRKALERDLQQLAAEISVQGHSVIHVIGANEDGEVVAESVTQPLFGFRVVNGHVDSTILECQQNTERRETEGTGYNVVVLDCRGAKLELVGVDLTTKGKQ